MGEEEKVGRRIFVDKSTGKKVKKMKRITGDQMVKLLMIDEIKIGRGETALCRRMCTPQSTADK